jgi:hypothetical protein
MGHLGTGFLKCSMPAAKLRAISTRTVYIRRLATLYTRIQFHTACTKADEKALIDSGTTENFIDEETWTRLGIGRKALKQPLTIHNVDGTENRKGKLTHYCWLRIKKGEQEKLQRFFITSLGKDRIILGYPFLYEFNPRIDWRNGKVQGERVKLESARFKYVGTMVQKLQAAAIRKLGEPKEGEALYIRRTNTAQEWAQEAERHKTHLTLETIPEVSPARCLDSGKARENQPNSEGRFE